jgi:mevalonate kinase
MIAAIPGQKYFYGSGKLLLTGEYFVCDGAQALALPTTIGQRMEIVARTSSAPELHWRSYTRENKLWFEAKFELWHFNILETESRREAEFLQKILRQVRVQNSHFLREEKNVQVKTCLEFPLEWGLGSSSTLIYNIAQWAYVSPFELQFKTIGGSGYDVACAQADGPILYYKEGDRPEWAPITFEPSFADKLYFVYLGKKQKTSEGLFHYHERRDALGDKGIKDLVQKISKLTLQIKDAKSLLQFNSLIKEHEEIVGTMLGKKPIKGLSFQDFWGECKSLGAWGGDFMLVTSDETYFETHDYFMSKGHDICVPFKELILSKSGAGEGA